MSQSVFIEEKRAQAKALSALILPNVREYFRSLENRAAFEKWYLEQHGKPYVWKKDAR